MGDTLKGRVAVVAGSGQGVGRAIAIGLATEGARVVTNNRRPGGTGRAILTDDQVKALGQSKEAWFRKETGAISGDAETTARDIREAGGEAVACFGDITDFEAAARLIKTAVDSFGGIDILVNVAGAFGFSPIEKMTEELWDRVNAVKPKGYFNTIRHAVPYMIAQKWGRIINCTSKAFMGDIIKHAEYCAANAGVVGLTRAVAIELRDRGITCNAFSPFALTRASYELETYEETVGKEDSQWVLGKPGFAMIDMTPRPEYIAPFVCYLASDAAAKISGSIFSLGGNGIGLYSEPAIARSITKFGEGPWTVQEIMQQAPRGLFAGYHSITENPM
jgi:3-oxoacyl-[acyl-carrier protein] reductase